MKNLTMMNHPMHLHGHFFRVLNKNGDYSPLKHTVNVAPMQTTTIEFEPDQYGDWFFHCHVLYHLESGMARVFSYGTPRDSRLSNFPLSKLINETDKFYTWGTLDVASQMSSIAMTSSNVRNQINFSAEYGWNKNLEADLSYERYLTDYFRVYGGLNVENKNSNNLSQFNPVGLAGIRYLLPYFINADLSLDSQVRPQIRLSAEYMIFYRTSIFGSYEFRSDFGIVNKLESGKTFKAEQVWNIGLDYMISRDFSAKVSYDSRFGAGIGLSSRF